MLSIAAWPMDWIYSPTAVGYLSHLVELTGIAFVVSLLLRWIGSRPFHGHGSTEPEDLGVYEAAYLRGGVDRVADAVMAGMFRSGQLEFIKPRRLRVKKSVGMEMGGLTHTVHQIAAAGGTVKDARYAVAYELDNLVDGLVEKGLVLGAGPRWLWRWLSAAPFILLTIAGGWRATVGYHRGEEIGLVVFLGLVTLYFMLLFGFKGMRTTVEGRRLLRGIKKSRRKKSLLSRGESSDWIWVCGLYGADALPGTNAADLQSALKPGSGGGGSDGDSGCSGCSGCGGCGD